MPRPLHLIIVLVTEICRDSVPCEPHALPRQLRLLSNEGQKCVSLCIGFPASAHEQNGRRACCSLSESSFRCEQVLQLLILLKIQFCC